MEWKLPRRNVLATGLSGLIPLTREDNTRNQTQSQEQTGVQGQVTDLSDNPVENAQIYLLNPDTLDQQQSSQLASTTTNAQGRFQADLAGSHDDVLYVCRKNNWFRMVTAAAGPDQGITLDRELLLTPSLAKDDKNGTPVGVANIWRRIGPDPSNQVILVEVTNTSAAQQDDINQITGIPFDLSSGWFSLSFPQNSVKVDYGSHTPVEIPISGPVGVWMADTPKKEGPHPVTTIHPANTGLPLAETGQVNYYEMGSAGDELQTIERGAGMLLSVVPGVGTAITWLEAVQWAIGDSLDSYGHIGKSDVPKKDPNTTDTVFEGWKSDNQGDVEEASVMFAVPIKLPSDSEVQFSAEAEWNITSGIGAGNTHGSLATEFAIGSTPENIGNSSDSGSAGDVDTPFNWLVNPANLREENAVYEKVGSNIQIRHPRAIFNALSDEIQGAFEAYAPSLATIGREITNQSHLDVLTNVRGECGIIATAFDVSRDDLITGLKEEGLTSVEPAINPRGWQLFEGEVEFGDMRDTSASILAAVKGNKTVVAPEYLESRAELPIRVIKDKETAMDIALATFEGELKSYPQSGNYGSRILGKFIEYRSNPTADSTAELVSNSQGYGLAIRAVQESDWNQIEIDAPREEVDVGRARFSRYQGTEERRTTMPIYGNMDIQPSEQKVETFDLLNA